jgi:hypothetical protein
MKILTITVHMNNIILVSGQRYIIEKTNVLGLFKIGAEQNVVHWILNTCNPVHVFTDNNAQYM